MDHCKRSQMPLSSVLDFSSYTSEKLGGSTPYRQPICALSHLVDTVIWDVSYAVGYRSRCCILLQTSFWRPPSTYLGIWKRWRIFAWYTERASDEKLNHLVTRTVNKNGLQECRWVEALSLALGAWQIGSQRQQSALAPNSMKAGSIPLCLL